MTTKAFSYLKAFGLFLLTVAAITFIIVFVKQYLRNNDILSQILDAILSVIMWFGYFSAWKLLTSRLKEIEKR